MSFAGHQTQTGHNLMVLELKKNGIKNFLTLHLQVTIVNFSFLKYGKTFLIPFFNRFCHDKCRLFFLCNQYYFVMAFSVFVQFSNKTLLTNSFNYYNNLETNANTSQ